MKTPSTLSRRQWLQTGAALGTAWLAPFRAASAAPAAAGASTHATPTNWLRAEAGARVHGFSSEFGAGWVTANLVPGPDDFLPDGTPARELVWSSAGQAPFPHRLVFDLGQPRWLTTFVFDNALAEEADHPGISARHLALWAGDAPERLRRVAAFELARNQREQAVRIEPLQARFLAFVIHSNWGHPWYTELGASRAFDDGGRGGDLAGELQRQGRADLYGLYFDFGQATLRPESAPTLEALLALHRAAPDQVLLLEGHTDAVGTAAANQALSEARAAAVRAALLARGARAASWRAVGRGASQPVAPNDTALGRARNRRVSVVKA